MSFCQRVSLWLGKTMTYGQAASLFGVYTALDVAKHFFGRAPVLIAAFGSIAVILGLFWIAGRRARP